MECVTSQGSLHYQEYSHGNTDLVAMDSVHVAVL